MGPLRPWTWASTRSCSTRSTTWRSATSTRDATSTTSRTCPEREQWELTLRATVTAIQASLRDRPELWAMKDAADCSQRHAGCTDSPHSGKK